MIFAITIIGFYAIIITGFYIVSILERNQLQTGHYSNIERMQEAESRAMFFENEFKRVSREKAYIEKAILDAQKTVEEKPTEATAALPNLH